MFDNLVGFTPDPAGVGDFIPFEKAAPADILDAQVGTNDWLEKLGVPSDADLDAKSQQTAAREAFTALNFDTDNAKQRTALAVIKTPAAVQHLAGMLTAYDWEFVNQAKELRGYTVSKILEETKHPDARIRLKALQMLGSVDASEEDVEKRLRLRLSKFLSPADGAAVTDVTPVSEPAPFVIPEASNEGEGMTLDAEIGIVAERRNA
jgi:hypothetical protein